MFYKPGKISDINDVIFSLYDTGADFFATGVTFAAGDVLISKDAGAFANVTNLPGEIGTGSFRLRLTATETTAAIVHVQIEDQSSPPAFLPTAFTMETYGGVGQYGFDLNQATPATNVTQIVGDTTAASRLKDSALTTIRGTVEDNSASYTGFISSLYVTGGDDHYVDRTIVWLDGPNSGSVSFATSYETGASFLGHTPSPDSGAPNSGDSFLLL